MQRRSPTAAAAAPDIAVVRFAAVYLLGDVLGKTCRLDTGPIAIERRIVTRAGINVVADMSAIGFHHVAAQPHDHGKTAHELTHHARENLLMASMRAFQWMVHAPAPFLHGGHIKRKAGSRILTNPIPLPV